MPMTDRNYYRGLPPLQRTPQQIVDVMTRTEPKSGAALIMLRWLTQDAAGLEGSR